MRNKKGEGKNGNSIFNIINNTHNCLYTNQKNRKTAKYTKLCWNSISMHACIQCIYLLYLNLHKNTNHITYSEHYKFNFNNNNINPNIQEKRNPKI